VSTMGCSIWLRLVFSLPLSIVASIQDLPILRLVWWISIYTGGLLSSVAVVALCQCGAGSLPGELVVLAFPFLSLPLAGRGLPG
jgi:hypothetical protein